MREAMAHLLVEGAQEAVARLNRACFKAPAAASMVQLASGLRKPKPNDLHVLGLSGAPQAVEPLLQLLPQTRDENDRYNVITAIGRLGADAAVPLLSRRYKDEDEDCRWATIKAFDYIATDAARREAQQLGTGDDFYPCDRLARRLAK